MYEYLVDRLRSLKSFGPLAWFLLAGKIDDAKKKSLLTTIVTPCKEDGRDAFMSPLIKKQKINGNACACEYDSNEEAGSGEDAESREKTESGDEEEKDQNDNNDPVDTEDESSDNRWIQKSWTSHT